MSLTAIYGAVLEGDTDATADNVSQALKANVSAEDILQKACIPAMGEVGRLFEIGEKYVPEMLISARAMKAATDILKPYLKEANVQALGKVALGTVAGDLHDIGKNLVGMMLEGAGFEIVDLGTDVAPEEFVAAVREKGAQIVSMSALLTTTMPSMQATIDALVEAGVRDEIKVLIGGAPVTQEFADGIGADGFAPDASSAARKAKELLDVA